MNDEIIDKIKGGDSFAFKALFEDFFPHVRYLCEKIVSDEDQAEDIALESFVKYWQNMSRLSTLNDVKAFIYVTAKNSCFNYLEHKKVKNKYVRSTLSVDWENEQLSPDIYIDQAAILESIYKEVDNLPQRCREVFKLYYIERLSRKEIATKLRISASTVDIHCATAIHKLRIFLSIKKLFIVLIINAIRFM